MEPDVFIGRRNRPGLVRGQPSAPAWRPPPSCKSPDFGRFGLTWRLGGTVTGTCWGVGWRTRTRTRRISRMSWRRKKRWKTSWISAWRRWSGSGTSFLEGSIDFFFPCFRFMRERQDEGGMWIKSALQNQCLISVDEVRGWRSGGSGEWVLSLLPLTAGCRRSVCCGGYGG